MSAAMPEAIQLLLREHEVIHEILTDTRVSLFAAVQDEEDEDKVKRAMNQVQDLVAFLEFDLEAHIAKEEDVLFPPLRPLKGELELVVEDMIVQHDAVKDRRAALERVLAELDHGHDDVRAARKAVADCANGTSARPSRDELERVRLAVANVDSMLQGHFHDEESDLFPPAVEVLPAEEFDRMLEAMKAIDAEVFGP